MSQTTAGSPQVAPQTWMKDMPFLGDRPLRDIVIPGSHDAGTYLMENRIDNNSSQCQEISVLEQLKAGARYLDLRSWKADDEEYWMYHGSVWTHVKLADVLKDIRTFLHDYDGEIVIATLLIDEKTNIDSGWIWACSEMADHLARPSDVNGKSFAEVTPNELKAAGKRFVMLRSGDAAQFACMDREGAYGDSLEPSNYVKALENLRIWSDKLWILHLGIPYKGDIHNTMPTRSEWNANEFLPRFRGTGAYGNWLERRFNIINVDFVQRFGWVETIVNLNRHTPKTWPTPMVPKTSSRTYTWTLKTTNKNGKLHIATETNSPFRAQQGQIHVYSAKQGFPDDPGGALTWAWDNDARSWDTGLDYSHGLCVAWMAEKSPNGPYVALVKVVTAGNGVSQQAAYTWKLRSGHDDNGTLFLEGDTDAPFRAQQGQLHVYRPGEPMPIDPDGKAEVWKWDNEAHVWDTGIQLASGRHVAWVAQESPNGPNTLFVTQTI